MLVAEIHGRGVSEVRDDEDLLTSAVFGHLRYVAPGRFWRELFASACTLVVEGTERDLTSLAARAQRDPGRYERLDVHFWPRHARYGEPDLLLCFSGGGQAPLAVLLEVKLWASKSGEGEYDQLVRYLRIADDRRALDARLPADARMVVVYLTPRRTTAELGDSLHLYGDTAENRQRLFQLRWQDMVEAIEHTLRAADASAVERLILTDVARFLRQRGLERFDGMNPNPYDADLHADDGLFYQGGRTLASFVLVDGLDAVEVVRGAWCHADGGR